jgi:hypothetical protein
METNSGKTSNASVCDAMTQINTMVSGLAPAMALGSLYQTLSNAAGMAAMNAVYAQQQANIAFQAATVKAVKYLLDEA